MSVLPLVTWPDPRLSTPCAAVGDIDQTARDLAADMLETLYDAGGRGLAAPQVGAMLRMFVMDAGWKTGDPSPIVLIDPEIDAHTGRPATGPEACLSMPGITAQVTRAPQITLRWTDLDGRAQRATWKGFAAICAQHEIDHLDGTMHVDRLTPAKRRALLATYEARL